MEKYIKIETVRSIFRDWACCTEDVDEFMSDIDGASTSDVAPVIHAEWVGVSPMVDTRQCSKCGYNVLDVEFETRFCPDCGARMDGQTQ